MDCAGDFGDKSLHLRQSDRLGNAMRWRKMWRFINTEFRLVKN